MKVYFVGSHSTGKTTLARYVSQKHNILMLPEVARAVLAEKELQLESLRTDLETVDDYQLNVFYRQIVEENKYKEGSFVSDRSLLDCCAYAAQHARVVSTMLDDSALPTYLEKLRSPDVFIFFVRPSKATLKADGVREAINWDGVVAIDAQIKFMLEMWKLRYFQINVDNMQERIRLIDSVLSIET